MTAPSTISPKSRAPILIRFALIPAFSIPLAVIIIAIGITRAVIKAARMLPSNRNKMTTTSSAPSPRFFCTVWIVAFTSFVRFKTVLALMPSGRDLLISASFISTAFETVRLFSPFSIIAVPTTTSWPFSLALPVRSSFPSATVATSFM